MKDPSELRGAWLSCLPIVESVASPFLVSVLGLPILFFFVVNTVATTTTAVVPPARTNTASATPTTTPTIRPLPSSSGSFPTSVVVVDSLVTPSMEVVDGSVGVDCGSLSLVRGVDSGANSVVTSALGKHSEPNND